MIALTCTNILFRLIWVPVRGTFELIGFFGAIVTAFALGYTQIRRGHIAVDILSSRFSNKFGRVLNAFNYLICALFFAITAWQISKWSTTLWKVGDVTETLRIVYYPFTYSVAFGCAILSLVFLTDLIRCLSQENGDPK
jgi:TRAP-type C4-dicarboxylate transport system permease small subunit